MSPCLFNFYAKYITVIQVYAPASNAEVADVEWFYEEYITRNAGLEEAQAGIKIAGRNINNLRNADDTTLMDRKQRGN